MEGLAITPDGKTLVGIMQAELIQDEDKVVRIVTENIATGATRELGYKLTTGSGVSETVALNGALGGILRRRRAVVSAAGTSGEGLGDDDHLPFSHTFSPPTQVSSTLVFRSSVTPASVGSWSTTMKSARCPTASNPNLSSANPA